MSSADEQTQKVSQLIERLLVDASFRAAFRKDPVAACRHFGLPDLAAELAQGGGKAMHTLEVRESKSSLAGVVMAVAAEGIGVVELHGLVEHGLLRGGMRAAGEQALRGVGGAGSRHPASSLHSELRAENPLHGAAGNPLGAAERGSMLAHEAGQSGGAPGSSSPAAASAGAPGGSASPAGASPGAAASAPGGSAAGAPVGSSAPGASAEGTSATGGAAGGAGASAAPSALSGSGAQPAGGAAPAWPAEPSPPPAVPVAPVASPEAVAPAVPAAPVVPPEAVPAAPAVPVASPEVVPAAPGAPVVSPEAVAPAVPAAPMASPEVVPAAPAAPGVAESPSAGVGTPLAEPGAVGAYPAVSATPSSAAEALAGPQARTAGGAATALAWAHSMLHGLPESEGANVGPALNRFEGAFGFHGAPWCGIFVGHALERAGLKVPDSIASVASILDMAQNGEGPFEKGILPVSAIRPGDLVTFGGTEHVAMVVKVDGEGIHTIAGNYENNVTEHTYPPGEVTGVVRPRYSAALPQVQALGPAPGGASSTPVVPSAAPAPGAAAVPGAAPADVVGAGSPAPVPGSAAASVAEAPGAAQLAEAPPAQPGTAVFQAVGRTSGASPHTVKFLQAVPAPSAEPAAAAGGWVSDPVAQAPGAPAAASEVAGQSPAAGVGAAPGAAAAPGEAVAGSTPGVPAEAAAPGWEPTHPVVEQSASVPGQAPGGVAEAASVVDAASTGTMPYPGDNAPKAEIAQWMGDLAQKHGLPRELPVMAALVESSLHNDNFGDRDSLGYFQMRTSIWDNGQYAGFPHDPALQVKWFIDQALAVKNQMPDRHFGSNPANFGEWIDEIERPAEEYRGRYQLQLDTARELLGSG